MNMLRVWGGAIYENDAFYDRCDELGLLVWQDFMFACAVTPHNDDYMESVRCEAEENVKRLRNHPCLVLWCGNNENLRMLYEWGALSAAPKEWQKDIADTYNRLYHEVLKGAVEKEDPGRFYWASSPQSSEGVRANRQSGDEHDWSVWFGEVPYENYNETYGRFVSEYGMQSLPDVRTLATFIPESEQNLHSSTLNNIQHSKMPWIAPDRNGNGQIEWYINNYYRKPNDFFATTYLSQLLQAETMRYAIEVHRQNMPRCMGTLYWQINDCWPTVSWSSVDFYGRWKAAHYFTREAYKKVILSPHYYKDTLTVYAVNDGEALSAQLHLEWYNFKGEMLDSVVLPVELEGNTSTLCYTLKREELLKKYNPKETVLLACLKNDEEVLAENNCYFAKVKELNLPRPVIHYEITKTGSSYAIKLSTDVLAKNLYIETANEGFLSDNFFDLYPNHPVTVTFEGNETPQITRLYSLIESIAGLPEK
jgi:beta-mannosidase